MIAWKLTFSGHLTGIIANQHPVILPGEADKATQFIRLCNQGYVYQIQSLTTVANGVLNLILIGALPSSSFTT